MMKIFFDTPPTSLWFITITMLLFLSECIITTFDIRIIQAKRSGNLPPDHPDLPGWVAILHWFDWIFKATLLVLNWRYAIGVIVVMFILKVLPVLETIGNILMAPFKPRGPNI
jgi:hypothetical protein